MRPFKKRDISLAEAFSPFGLVKVVGVGHDHPNEGQKKDKKPEPTHVPYLGEWVGL
jgi:hypothetical protein